MGLFHIPPRPPPPTRHTQLVQAHFVTPGHQEKGKDKLGELGHLQRYDGMVKNQAYSMQWGR